MYKVFINDRVILLTDEFADYSSTYDTLFINYNSIYALSESVKTLRESDVVSGLCVYSDNLEKLWDDFNGLFKCIHAAGGVVKKDGKVLMIYKNKHWDLPKGKIDASESVEDAAIREVSEESGLKSLSISKGLDPTYYLYQENGDVLLKKTDWFLMSSLSDGPLKGDEKEGITDVQWIDEKQWSDLKNDSYPSVINTLSSIF